MLRDALGKDSDFERISRISYGIVRQFVPVEQPVFPSDTIESLPKTYHTGPGIIYNTYTFAQRS
jgi:hypothetical protein